MRFVLRLPRQKRCQSRVASNLAEMLEETSPNGILQVVVKGDGVIEKQSKRLDLPLRERGDVTSEVGHEPSHDRMQRSIGLQLALRVTCRESGEIRVNALDNSSAVCGRIVFPCA
jgi:hypothetical protein